MNKKELNNRDKIIGIGIALGVAFGVAIDNVGLGICLGLAIGAGVASTQNNKTAKNKN
jgi:hypothetical protein